MAPPSYTYIVGAVVYPVEAGNAIAFIIPAFSVHVVVCVAPPPPVIIIVGGVTKLPPAVIVKEVNRFVVIFAVILINPPPFHPIIGALVYPAPIFVKVTVLIEPAACVHVAVAIVVAPPP